MKGNGNTPRSTIIITLKSTPAVERRQGANWSSEYRIIRDVLPTPAFRSTGGWHDERAGREGQGRGNCPRIFKPPPNSLACLQEPAPRTRVPQEQDPDRHIVRVLPPPWWRQRRRRCPRRPPRRRRRRRRRARPCPRRRGSCAVWMRGERDPDTPLLLLSPLLLLQRQPPLLLVLLLRPGALRLRERVDNAQRLLTQAPRLLLLLALSPAAAPTAAPLQRPVASPALLFFPLPTAAPLPRALSPAAGAWAGAGRGGRLGAAVAVIAVEGGGAAPARCRVAEERLNASEREIRARGWQARKTCTDGRTDESNMGPARSQHVRPMRTHLEPDGGLERALLPSMSGQGGCGCVGTARIAAHRWWCPGRRRPFPLARR